MLGVYNNMVVGLALTGLVALGVHMLAVTTDPSHGGRPNWANLLLTAFGQTLYLTPVRWLVMLAPLGFVLFFSFRINQMSASSARTLFLAFAATMGLSLSTILAGLYRNVGRPRFLRDGGGFRRLEPLWLHDEA